MSYAIRKDGNGWRAVGGPEDVAEEEIFSEDQPGPTAATQADIIAEYERELDQHLDAAAHAKRYTDRFTFALRAGYPGPYHAEGVAFAQWMDACNAQAYQLLQSVQAGTAPLPSLEAFIASLPALVLP